jgi:membrane fusion protein (multidrug efflux system)
MIKRLIIAVILIALIGGGLVGFNMFRSQAISDFFATMQPPAVTISAEEAEAVTWQPTIEAVGTSNALRGIDLVAEASGVIQQLAFSANDQIEEGQLLVQIDDRIEQADIVSARAQVDQDRQAAERARTLSTSGAGSAVALETAQTALAASTATLQRLEAVLDQKSVEAPFAGMIGIPRVSVGEFVQPGTVIATLQDLSNMRVDFTVPEQSIGQLTIGQPVRAGFATGDLAFEGRIIGIDPRVDPSSRLISLRAQIENPEGEVRPGQFLRVAVELPTENDVLVLPQTAVVTSLYGDYVYVVGPADAAPAAGEDAAAAPTDEAPAATTEEPAAEAPADAAEEPAAAATEERLAARQVFVTPGRRSGGLVEILDGIEVGAMVVTSGQNKLSSGTPVVVNNSVDTASAGTATTRRMEADAGATP